jgi:hypothetical protein
MARTAGQATNVKGLQQVLRELRKFNPDLLKELREDLKDQAQPIIKDAGRRMPERAARGWASRGRTGYSRDRAARGLKVSLRASRRVEGMRGSYAVVEIYQGNAGGAIWDQAGTRGNYKPPTQRGAAFVDALTRSSGKPQRGLWPASVGKRKAIAKDFERSIREAERKANARMRMAA